MPSSDLKNLAEELLELAAESRRSFMQPPRARGRAREAQLRPRELQVLLAIDQHPDWSLRQIAEKLELSRGRVSLALAALREDGLVDESQSTVDRRRTERRVSGAGWYVIARFLSYQAERRPRAARKSAS